MSEYENVPGILLLYEDHLGATAGTVHEHLGAFQKYSEFPVFPLNVVLGIPPALNGVEFAVTVFHYTLNPIGTWITPETDAYLASRSRTYKVAIFQDEIWYFKERMEFLNRYGIDCLFTRHKPRHWQDIYGAARHVKRFVYYLAGYVAPELIEAAAALRRPLETRPIDVGYRGRRLPYYMGKGAQEKAAIAEQFLDRAWGLNLSLDITVDEKNRIYGPAWHQFLARCKAMLGVEGGVSVLDLNDTYRKQYEYWLTQQPGLTFDQFAALMGEHFAQLEDRIDYRAFTPRHFEAAAFQNVQILFEGRYDGMLTPGVHYVSLRKDFANFGDVIAQLNSPNRLRTMVEKTYDDLIASGRYSYQVFVEGFDRELRSAGIDCRPMRPKAADRLRVFLADWSAFRQRFVAWTKAVDAVAPRRFDLRWNRKRVWRLLNYHAKRVWERRVEEYTSKRRQATLEQDQRFWRRLCRLASFPVPPDAGHKFDPPGLLRRLFG